MKSKLALAGALLAVSALALSACSGTTTTTDNPTATDQDPFNFLFIGGVTGPLASLTASELAADAVAIDEINDAGGINGRKVVIEVLDSKADPTEAVSVLQKRLAQGPKPDLIRAGLSSTEALAMLPVVSRAGIPSYTSSASALTDDVEAYPYNKQVSPKFLRQVEIGRTYVEFKKYKKLTVLAPEDASGDSNVAGVESVYKDSGIKVEVVRFNPADLDLSVAYQRAVATDPDVIYANCLGAPCVRVVAARESVAGGTDIPMFGDTSMAGAAGGPAASVPASAIENLHVEIFAGQLKTSKPTEQFSTFYKGLEKELGEVTGLSAPTVSYDGLRMWALAFNEAGSTDAAEGIKTINGLKFPAGFFVGYGSAEVTYDADSAFPQLPDDAFAVVEVSPLDGGLYPAVDAFQPKVKK